MLTDSGRNGYTRELMKTDRVKIKFAIDEDTASLLGEAVQKSRQNRQDMIGTAIRIGLALLEKELVIPKVEDGKVVQFHGRPWLAI